MDWVRAEAEAEAEPFTLPASFVETLAGLQGSEAWLAKLPDLLDYCARRWQLRILPPFANLSYNYVAPAVQADGVAVVVKLGIPRSELSREMLALELYSGLGSVRLVDADREQGCLLLERLLPGTPLSNLADDDQATLIAAQTMAQLWRPLPADHPFRPVEAWIAGLARLRTRFGGATGPLPPHLVDRAERLFGELVSSSAQPVLLHGDLHHDNILSAQRLPWLAIDPKGVVGEPAYEVGALLRNPLQRLRQATNLKQLLARRIDLLAEALAMDRERLVGWGMAQAVLSAWWSMEDHGSGWEPAMAVAEALAGL